MLVAHCAGRRPDDAVRSLPRPGDRTGYIWLAGETGVLRGVRTYLRKELDLPATAFKVVGHWQTGPQRRGSAAGR